MLLGYILGGGCIAIAVGFLVWMLFVEPAQRRRRNIKRGQEVRDLVENACFHGRPIESIMPTIIDREDQDFF